MSSAALLIGIGNAYRSDDAVGLVVIRALQAKELPETCCIESNGDGAALIDAWANAGRVILIDAVSSGAKPGTIYRFEALTQPIPTVFSFPSTHAFGVAEAVLLARALHQLPASLLIYGIEGKNFTTGTSLSAEVENAGREVIEQIVKEAQESF